MYKFIKELREEYLVNEEYINSIEKKYDITFPLILKDYYLKYNGSRIKECRFNIDGFGYGVYGMVQIMYGGYPFEKKIENDRMDGFISPSMIAFAYNGGGDYFYCDLKDGKIYVIYDIIENPIYICDSVSEFFKIMEENIYKE